MPLAPIDWGTIPIVVKDKNLAAQLAAKGLVVTKNADGSFTATGTIRQFDDAFSAIVDDMLEEVAARKKAAQEAGQ